MDESERTGSARKRQLARKRRRNRQQMAVPRTDSQRKEVPISEWFDRLSTTVNRLRQNRGAVPIAVGVLLVVFLFAFFNGRLPPNVFILDTPIGGLTYDEAVAQLATDWSQDVRVNLTSGEQSWAIAPSRLGVSLDVQGSVSSAYGLGFAGIPFGYGVAPVISVDQDILRQSLEELADEIYVAPTNARYEWRDDAVFGISGQNGIELDIDATFDHINETLQVGFQDEFALVTSTLVPTAGDPSVFIEEAQAFVTTPFELSAYDPFEDRHISFTANPEVLSSWIQADENHLVVVESALSNYIDTFNDTPDLELPENGYLQTDEAIQSVNDALASGALTAQLTIRSQPSTYEVVSGDSGYRISRKTGIPFFLIEEANPDVDLSVLSPGDTVNIPSRDVTLPLPVVADKRIIVDLDTQYLVAYENDQRVFEWQISSGISQAPTSPGVYQILSHVPVAYGSSYALCDSTGCGQWELNWFMGIYEVVPGLVNGFHGAVLLPNGSYLGGNNVGEPYTFGCVMSREEQAKTLYDWAEIGTIVEIISSEYPPQSDLARQAFNL